MQNYNFLQYHSSVFCNFFAGFSHQHIGGFGRLNRRFCSAFARENSWKATLEVSLSGDVYPVLHIYKWDSHSAIPVEVCKYAPKDFVIQEFRYGLYDLYVKGYYIVDELYAGDTGYLKITVERTIKP